jgi:uncharacterized surface protein with fasciclin (FAS1) repeats
MRKILFTIACLLCGHLLFAQDSPPAPKVDSTSLEKPRKVSKSDLKPIEGTNIVPAKDIDANIRNSKNLSRFYDAIKKAGLPETFRSKGPVTIFVPDNDAISSMPKGKLDTLLQAEHKYDLIALIMYHALAGKVTVKDLARQINAGKGKAQLTTLTGSRLTALILNN